MDYAITTMKLTLVERQEVRLRCIPDLGIAYLLGQCKDNGIKASLVQGSPRTLDCLLDESVFDILCRGYEDVVKERGESWFKDFLKFNHDIATSSNIWDKTNPDAMKELWDLTGFMKERVWPEWLADFLHQEIVNTKPDAVGFSIWDFYSHPGVSAAVRDVIERLKLESDVRVLVGGPGTVTKTARRDIFRTFKPDFIVHHEGERALFEALGMIESGKVRGLPNVSFSGYDGETKPIEDLDSLALPDFSQYDLDRFFLPVRVVPMMTSRGCPWARCAFCNHHATYKGYREHSAERVVETVEMYKKKYKTDMIMFHDETFTSGRARNIVDALPEAFYYSYAYPKGFDRALLKRMHEKGFRVLVWGVESGCQEVLDSMRKGTDISEVGRIVRDARAVGITNVAFILFGFPGETKEQAEETVNFLQRNADYIERHATTVFRLEEGSPIWEEPSKWGVKKLKGGDYRVESGMQREDVHEFLAGLNGRDIKTSANTKYYMPGNSEFRPYFFMQVAYGEGKGEYPVKNGLLVGDEVRPSMLMEGVSRPVLKLDKGQRGVYEKCDGRHKVDARGFRGYPYVVYYERPFGAQ